VRPPLVRRAAALVLFVAQVEQLVGDVDLTDRHVDHVLEDGVTEDAVGVLLTERRTLLTLLHLVDARRDRQDQGIVLVGSDLDPVGLADPEPAF
jgi:hypothetical protein